MRLIGPRPWIRCAALAAAAWFAAAGPAAAAGSVVGGAEGRQWLLRMHNAATQSNYHGTLVVTADGSVSSSRVTHYCVGGQSHEMLDVLDGQPRRVLRHNDQVLTMWPAARLARLEQREAVPPFPSLLSGREDELFDRYDMIDEGRGRVAGLDVAVFLMRPRDKSRFARRLWAEPASGLLLREDVVASDGRVLETSAFSDVTVGGNAKPPKLQSMLRQIEGWRVQRPASRPTTLEAEGWLVKVPVAGFRQSSCVRRQLEAAPDDPGVSSSEVVQAIFTDGLTHVSLFIEPLRGERRRGGAASGATHTWMQPLGSHWITVMGDVPMATLKQFAGALERR